MTSRRKPGRFVPQGCESFTDGEIDLLHGIKYSYYMDLGRLVENKFGLVSKDDFKNLEEVTNECIQLVFATAADRIFKENGATPIQ